MTPTSGARAGTRPSRSERGAGDGRVGERNLTCGHTAVGSPAVAQPGRNGRSKWWCDTCKGFRRLR